MTERDLPSLAQRAAAAASEAVPVTVLPKTKLAKIAADFARDFDGMTEAEVRDSIRECNARDLGWLRAYMKSVARMDDEPRSGESDLARRRRSERILDALRVKF